MSEDLAFGKAMDTETYNNALAIVRSHLLSQYDGMDHRKHTEATEKLLAEYGGDKGAMDEQEAQNNANAIVRSIFASHFADKDQHTPRFDYCDMEPDENGMIGVYRFDLDLDGVPMSEIARIPSPF